jgi:hypothetical protein
VCVRTCVRVRERDSGSDSIASSTNERRPYVATAGIYVEMT